jgi:hypothetical protein
MQPPSIYFSRGPLGQPLSTVQLSLITQLSSDATLPHTVQFCFLPFLSSIYCLILRWLKTHKGMDGVGFEPSSNLLWSFMVLCSLRMELFI